MRAYFAWNGQAFQRRAQSDGPLVSRLVAIAGAVEQ
jgi:hypothetical protein